MIETKSFRAEVKAYDAILGTFEAIVSVFGNVDLGGDRVVKGAFTKTLQEWQAKGDPIPVIWSHEWNDPASHIGVVTAAEERDTGLWVRAQLDIEANDKAAYIARLMKQRRITQFSFGYYTRDSKMVTDPDGTPVREITDVELFEVGPTLLGMNPATVLLEAASATMEDLKAGRVLSGKNEQSLVQARDLIDQVLAQLNADSRVESVNQKSVELKASADEIAEGVFVSWPFNNIESVGRVEYVMTEGSLGYRDSQYVVEASAENPALLVRIFQEVNGTYAELETFIGKRTSDVTVIEDPRASTSSQKSVTENSEEEAIQAPADDAARDSAPNIDHELLTELLARTRYTQE